MSDTLRKTLISPSILTADFGNIGEAVRKLEKAKADYVHCDVMDGHFVPNLTFGSKFVSDLKKYTKLPLDVHLMISRPDLYIERFADAGADIITFHAEAECDTEETLALIRARNIKAGIALSPDTPVDVVEKYSDFADLVLLMSVYPGFGGQKFIEDSYSRARKIKDIIIRRGSKIHLEIDGGVNFANARKIKDSGVDILVAGSAVFSSEDMGVAIRKLAEC